MVTLVFDADFELLLLQNGKISFIENSGKNVLARAHKKFCRIQHLEIYLIDLKIQYEHKMKLPLNMIRKHVLLYLHLPEYMYIYNTSSDSVIASFTNPKQERVSFKASSLLSV